MGLTATLSNLSEDRRGVDRRPIALGSTARDPADGIARDVVVHDLSCEGLRLETDVELIPGSVISIGLPGVGTRLARVVRRHGPDYGCRFEDPIGPAQLHKAFSVDPVARGAFAELPAAGTPEPYVQKWHPALRIALVMGLATTLWTSLLRIHPF